jgi:hypothetical protein
MVRRPNISLRWDVIEWRRGRHEGRVLSVRWVLEGTMGGIGGGRGRCGISWFVYMMESV